MKRLINSIIILLVLSFFSCEKEITVEIPAVEPKLVVDGRIEIDVNPFVILTKSSGYFDPANFEAIAASFVNDASITISDGTTTEPMIKLCSSTLPPSQIGQIAESTGVDSALLANYDVCAYTHPWTGEVGKTYTITIDWNSKIYTSSTTLFQPIPLDSTWFEVETGFDSLGFMWAILSDPPGLGNYYYWEAKRINTFKYGEQKGEVKDQNFLAPTNPSFDDTFFDGLTFDFAYDRARGDASQQGESGPERGFFKQGDTVVIKFSAIDKGVYKFHDDLEIQVNSNGSPFASPINITTNVEGGALGLWAAYGSYYDTVVCQ